MRAVTERLRRLRLSDVAQFALYIAFWAGFYGVCTATGFWIWDEGTFVSGALQGAALGFFVCLGERWLDRPARREARAPAGSAGGPSERVPRDR